jgi:demethylmenaquinone methyltransferase/2-methoxy-6-polyprenyl-1,4-benzoquinol methylase
MTPAQEKGRDTTPDANDSVEAMRRYYVQRAAYYERVYHKPERQTDLRAMEAWIEEPFAGRDVLEIACGTGWWTPHAARRCRSWLATDVNPETMDVARSKNLPASVRFEQVDAYSLAELGERRFDAAFAGCWWSHVPLQRLPAWLERLHARLLPGARVVFLDNSYVQASSTPVTRRDGDGNTYQTRTLDDGSTHEVLKNFPAAEEAFAQLGPRARAPRWTAYTHYWVLDYTLA